MPNTSPSSRMKSPPGATIRPACCPWPPKPSQALPSPTDAQAKTLTVVADTGYRNGAQSRECEDRGITPVVPMAEASNTRNAGHYAKPLFTYDAQRDAFTCPAGQILTRFKRDQTQQIDYYRTQACAGCGTRQTTPAFDANPQRDGETSLRQSQVDTCGWISAAHLAQSQGRDGAWGIGLQSEAGYQYPRYSDADRQVSGKNGG